MVGSEEKVVQIPLSDLKHFLGRAKHLYMIRTEEGDYVPFELNEAQQILHAIVEEEFERNMRISGIRKCKIIVLKGRQVGATTYTAIRFTDEILQANKYGLVATHTDDDTALIYDKYEIAYDNLPDYIEIIDDAGNVMESPDGHTRVPYKPTHDKYSAKSLKFKKHDGVMVDGSHRRFG
jgi:hypothetical protein